MDADARRARVGGGAHLADLEAAIHEHGLATPAGVISHTKLVLNALSTCERGSAAAISAAADASAGTVSESKVVKFRAGVVTKGGNTVSTADTPVTGDIVVLAVPYPAVVDILAKRADQFVGKVVVDITTAGL